MNFVDIYFNLFSVSLVQGAVFAFPALAVMIPFRMLGLPDLTSEGAFPFGAAVAAALTVAGLDPFVSLLAAILFGLLDHIHRRGAAVGLGRRFSPERRVRPLGVVEVDPLADDALGLEAVGELAQIDGLVFERAPQPLNEDVVQVPAPAVHRDPDADLPQEPGEGEAGELAALVGIEA